MTLKGPLYIFFTLFVFLDKNHSIPKGIVKSCKLKFAFRGPSVRFCLGPPLVLRRLCLNGRLLMTLCTFLNWRFSPLPWLSRIYVQSLYLMLSQNHVQPFVKCLASLIYELFRLLLKKSTFSLKTYTCA